MACSMVRRIVNDFPVQKTRAICIKRLFFFWIQYELKYTRPHRVLQHFANQIVRYLFIRPAQIGKMWTTNNLLFIEASTQMQYDIITEFIIGVFIFSKINGKPAKKKIPLKSNTHINAILHAFASIVFTIYLIGWALTTPPTMSTCPNCTSRSNLPDQTFISRSSTIFFFIQFAILKFLYSSEDDWSNGSYASKQFECSNRLEATKKIAQHIQTF